MTMGVTIINNHQIIMGADSAISRDINGIRYRMPEEQQKILQFSNMLIFRGGDVLFAELVIDEFKKCETHNIDVLHGIILKVWSVYVKSRPIVLEAIKKGVYTVNAFTIGTFEGKTPVLYKIQQDKNFQLERFVVPPNKYYVNCDGVKPREGTTLTNKLIDKGLSVVEIFKGVFDELSDQAVGGILRTYEMTKDGVKLVQEHNIKEKPTLKYLPQEFNHELSESYIEEIKRGIQTAHIVGSDITLHDGNGVMKMSPKIGFWAGENAENFEDAAFSVDMFGNMKAHKAQLIGKKGEILIDTDAGFIDMDKLDIINIGKLMAEMLQVNTILANKSYINDLTVNKLKTLPKDVEVGEYVDYIEIQDNYIDFITAKVSSKIHASDSRDRLLFWQDEEKRILTTDDTGIIAYAYDFKPSEIKVKQKITFEGSGSDATPRRIIGQGDGTPNGAKAIETKYAGGFKIEYGQSNTGKSRSIDLRDNGVLVNAEDGRITISGKELNAIADSGVAKFGNDKAYIEMTADGKMNFHAVEFNFFNN